MIEWKREKIHSADELAKRMKRDVVVYYVIWSDWTVSVAVSRGVDLEFSMDVWEDFNLRYNWKDF